MAVTPSSPVVGVFQDRSQAEQAIDALYASGFTSEQVRTSTPTGTSGSILADLKNLFTGQNTNSGNITNDLTNIGLPDEEAQYYSNAYNSGSTILAVVATGREQEALTILQQYGAYNAHPGGSSAATPYSQQPATSTQQATTPDGNSLQYNDTPGWATQQQPYDGADYPFQNAQQVVTTPGSDTEVQGQPYDEIPATQISEDQPTQPVTSEYDATAQDTAPSDDATYGSTSQDQAAPAEYLDPTSTSQDQAAPADTAVSDTVASDPTSTYENTPSELTTPTADYPSEDTPANTVVSDANSEAQTAPADAAPYASDYPSGATSSEPVAPDADMASATAPTDTTTPASNYTSEPVAPDAGTASEATPADTTTPASNYTSEPAPSESVDSPVSQASSTATGTAEPVDEFQQLQEQLQAAQQQLQEAQAQLQAAKEHEAQIQTIREREQRLQTARQQLQDIQAQLQATLAELHETQARISQYS